MGPVLYDGDNDAAHSPKGGPAEAGGLSALSLPLVLIPRPSQMPIGLAVPGKMNEK